MGLNKVKKKLKSIGVEFQYEKNDYFNEFDLSPLICKVTFKDVRGTEYEAKETFRGRSHSKIVKFNNSTYSQTDICEWLDANLILMTDLNALVKEEEERKKARQEEDYQNEIIDVKEFTSDKYKMVVSTSRKGRVYYRIETINNNRFTPTMRVESGFSRRTNPVVEIQTTAFGTISSDEAKILAAGWIKAYIAAEYFTGVLTTI